MSVGSVLFPKLLGSYERGLTPLFTKLLNDSYDIIIDIGSAEGYYAVGCALKTPNVHVYAFDTSEEARSLCGEMAVINDVKSRVTIRSECTEEELGKLVSNGRALIICDCEGCERNIFTESMVEVLAEHDVLVETHNFMDPEISMNIVDIYKIVTM